MVACPPTHCRPCRLHCRLTGQRRMWRRPRVPRPGHHRLRVPCRGRRPLRDQRFGRIHLHAHRRLWAPCLGRTRLRVPCRRLTRHRSPSRRPSLATACAYRRPIHARRRRPIRTRPTTSPRRGAGRVGRGSPDAGRPPQTSRHRPARRARRARRHPSRHRQCSHPTWHHTRRRSWSSTTCSRRTRRTCRGTLRPIRRCRRARRARRRPSRRRHRHPSSRQRRRKRRMETSRQIGRRSTPSTSLPTWSARQQWTRQGASQHPLILRHWLPCPIPCRPDPRHSCRVHRRLRYHSSRHVACGVASSKARGRACRSAA